MYFLFNFMNIRPIINNEYILNNCENKLNEQRKINRSNMLNEHRKIETIEKSIIQLLNIIYSENDLTIKNENNNNIEYIKFINDCFKYYFNEYLTYNIQNIQIDFDSPKYGSNGLEIAIIVYPKIHNLYKILINKKECMELIQNLIFKNINITYELMYEIINNYRDLKDVESNESCIEETIGSCIYVFKKYNINIDINSENKNILKNMRNY